MKTITKNSLKKAVDSDFIFGDEGVQFQAALWRREPTRTGTAPLKGRSRSAGFEILDAKRRFGHAGNPLSRGFWPVRWGLNS